MCTAGEEPVDGIHDQHYIQSLTLCSCQRERELMAHAGLNPQKLV